MKINFIFFFLITFLPSCGYLFSGKQNVLLLDKWMSGSTHWFPNEKTIYFFWETSNVPQNKEVDYFKLNISFQQANGQTSEQEIMVDYNSGVYEHTGLRCGIQRYENFEAQGCFSSFSLKSEAPPIRVILTWQTKTKKQIEQAELYIQSHEATETSVVGYATYSSVQNNSMQAVYVHNFGYPDNQGVAKFGLVKHWTIDKGQSMDVPADYKIGTLPYFPVEFCHNSSFTPISNEEYTRQTSAAFQVEEDEQAGRCLKLHFYNQQKQEQSNIIIYGRKNPQLEDSYLDVSLNPTDVDTVNIVFEHCQTNLHHDDKYYEFQTYILDFTDPIEKAPCYDLAQADTYAQQIKEFIIGLKSKYIHDRDLIFKIILHHQLAKGMQTFQQMVAQAVVDQVDIYLKSPRFLGAVVFDSTTDYIPKSPDVAPFLRWLSTDNPMPDINILGLKLRFIESAFASYDYYTEYQEKWNEEKHMYIERQNYVFKSMPADDLSLVLNDGTQWVSFMNQLKVHVDDGHYLRYCEDEKNAEYVKAVDSATVNSPDYQLIDMSTFKNELILNESSKSYLLGVSWKNPWAGFLKYSTLTQAKAGTFMSLPLNIDILRNETQADLGQSFWLDRTPFKLHFQKCTKYCEHPIFDERGVYQHEKKWKDWIADCPKVLYPGELAK